MRDTKPPEHEKSNHLQGANAQITPAPSRMSALRGMPYDMQAAALEPAPAVQKRLARQPQMVGDTREVAASGVSGQGTSLPHAERLQAAFGRHDISPVKAHVGGQAAAAADAMGAEAYASGDSVAFKSTPDLRTAAHEAAHVIQQRSGVHLSGGVGKAGDPYEQEADAVADAVVQGKSVETMLPSKGAASKASGSVQKKSPEKSKSTTTEEYNTLTGPEEARWKLWKECKLPSFDIKDDTSAPVVLSTSGKRNALFFRAYDNGFTEEQWKKLEAYEKDKEIPEGMFGTAENCKLSAGDRSVIAAAILTHGKRRSGGELQALHAANCGDFALLCRHYAGAVEAGKWTTKGGLAFGFDGSITAHSIVPSTAEDNEKQAESKKPEPTPQAAAKNSGSSKPDGGKTAADGSAIEQKPSHDPKVSWSQMGLRTDEQLYAGTEADLEDKAYRGAGPSKQNRKEIKEKEDIVEKKKQAMISAADRKEIEEAQKQVTNAKTDEEKKKANDKLSELKKQALKSAIDRNDVKAQEYHKAEKELKDVKQKSESDMKERQMQYWKEYLLKGKGSPYYMRRQLDLALYEEITPGDWLWYHNGNSSHSGDHSVIFAGWASEWEDIAGSPGGRCRQANVYSQRQPDKAPQQHTVWVGQPFTLSPKKVNPITYIGHVSTEAKPDVAATFAAPASGQVPAPLRQVLDLAFGGEEETKTKATNLLNDVSSTLRAAASKIIEALAEVGAFGSGKKEDPRYLAAIAQAQSLSESSKVGGLLNFCYKMNQYYADKNAADISAKKSDDLTEKYGSRAALLRSQYLQNDEFACIMPEKMKEVAALIQLDMQVAMSKDKEPPGEAKAPVPDTQASGSEKPAASAAQSTQAAFSVDPREGTSGAIKADIESKRKTTKKTAAKPVYELSLKADPYENPPLKDKNSLYNLNKALDKRAKFTLSLDVDVTQQPSKVDEKLQNNGSLVAFYKQLAKAQNEVESDYFYESRSGQATEVRLTDRIENKKLVKVSEKQLKTLSDGRPLLLRPNTFKGMLETGGANPDLFKNCQDLEDKSKASPKKKK